jgi:hypothetical protein
VYSRAAINSSKPNRILILIAIDISFVSKALKSKEKDFEDMIQLQCAQSLSEIGCTE